MQYCIISINAKNEAVAWGPFGKLATAKEVKKALERKFPLPKHLILNFQDISELKDVRIKG